MPEQDFNLIFSNKLRYFLEMCDMTQAELAKRLGVGNATVSDWVNARKSPRMSKVDAMCEIFHCKRSDFMNDEPKDTEETYYINEETARVAQELFENKNLRMLFDAAKDSKPQDLQMAAEMLRRFKETNPDG